MCIRFSMVPWFYWCWWCWCSGVTRHPDVWVFWWLFSFTKRYLSFFTLAISFWLVTALFIYCLASSKVIGALSNVTGASLFSLQPLRNACLGTVFLKYSGMPSYPSVARSSILFTNSPIDSLGFCLSSCNCSYNVIFLFFIKPFFNLLKNLVKIWLQVET